MTASSKTKTRAANLPVPQNRDEAARFVTRVGELTRELTRRETDMNDVLARTKEQFEQAAQPLREQLRETTAGLGLWCEANRDALTAGGKTKTADLGTGTVAWRRRPPKVTLRGKVEEIVARLRTLGLARFIRTKEEVNKEAMLEEPDVARTVCGVSVASEGEDFVVEPFEATLPAEVRS